ncbi:synaptonemal complex protein 1 [Tautogolabrus adspersus]
MERDRGFNFKLLVPPRVNKGQVSAVRPQEILENCGDFMNTLDQGYSKCFDKVQSMHFVNTSVVGPTKPTRQDFSKMKVVPPMEKDENNCNPGKLYTKLFDEVEKIKSWKIKADSDTVQKERRLQENKRTIETQRKAIQELQFGNESLTIKLEERISENEDLRNKHNATRNLCNLLKDTFERSAEKMHLFESEREETHHIFMENSGSIQKLIAAFESLRIQAEADQQEMQKVKEGLQQFEILKEKFKEEYDMKEEQREAIASLLKESKEEYAEMIQSRDFSLQELSRVKNQQAEKQEQIQTTMQELQNSLSSEIQKAKELEDKLITNTGELERRNTLLGESMEQSAMKDGRIKDLEDELDTNTKSVESMQGKMGITEIRVKELEAELLRKNKEARLLKNEADVASAENDMLKKTCEAAEKEHEDLKEKSAETEIKVQKLEHQLFSEIEKNKENTCQMDQLKKDITQHEEKYKKLLSNFNGLQCEKEAIEQQFESGSSNVKAIEANIKVSEEKAVKLTREIQRLEEENQCLQEEVNSCKTRLQGKYQETETLQKQIEEKGEHLQEEITEKEKQIKSVETKLFNLRKKFEIRLRANDEFQKENKMLKKQIAKEIAKSSELETVINNLYEESQNLKQMKVEDHQKLLNDLESKSTSATELENEVQKLRITTAEAVKNKDEAELKCQQKIADMVALMEKHKSQYDRMVEEKDAELDENKKREMEAVSQKKSLELDLLKNKADNDKLKQQLKTEVSRKANLQKELSDMKKEMSSLKITQLSGSGNKQEIQNGDLKTPQSIPRRVGGSSKIKSYRIRTPPSTEKAVCWKKTIVLDPKSDSSDLGDLLTFASAPPANFSAPSCERNIFKKIQSPAPHKSPGNSLKLAAMKRMRDAGWTAVTGCNKKKKKTNEKIFA